MAIFLALAAAATYGGADFLGGLVTRRAHVLVVVLISQMTGAVLLALLWPFFDAPYDGGALFWGFASGVAGAAGVVLLYLGLARGRMSVVAPITAVEAASVPVVFGVLTGERPSVVALLGVAFALVAVALVSSSGTREDRSAPRLGPGVLEALGAGLAFGAFFILLKQTGSGSGLWPLVGARISSVGFIALGAAFTRPSFRTDRNTMFGIAGSGALDLSANLLYLLASRRGLLSLVAVLTSMYPASTVLLARFVLGERMTVRQVEGLALAVAGIVLIATG